MADNFCDGMLLHSTDHRLYRVHNPRWWQFFRRLWFWRKGKRTGNTGTISVRMDDGSIRELSVYEVWSKHG
jgi:hypothetical protein